MDKVIRFNEEEIDLLRRILSKQIWIKETVLSLIYQSLSYDTIENARDEIRFVDSIYRKLS